MTQPEARWTVGKSSMDLRTIPPYDKSLLQQLRPRVKQVRSASVAYANPPASEHIARHIFYIA